MSKQSQANTIFLQAGISTARKEVIIEIMAQIGVKEAYASTLYATAKRQTLNKSHVTVTPTKPSATSHVKPAVKAGAKITSFGNKALLREMREEITMALEVIAAKRGITLAIGNISYSDEKFTTKLTATTGDGSDAAAKNWNQNCWRFGLAEDQIGETFMSNGTEFTITGMNARRKKFPISGVNARGTGYKFPASRGRQA